MAEQIINKQPVKYLQTDSKWKSKPYRVPGENSTIGGSGCGPTSAAMILATIVDKNITPVETCKWSVDHGYKALNQGTYYAYFKPQFEYYGIECYQMLGKSLKNQPNHPIHDEVKKLINEGWYIIALMKKGLWTSGGHFIVLYQWHDGKIYINDPASTKSERLVTDENGVFKEQVANYWAINAVDFNKKHGEVEDDEMLSYEQFKEYQKQYEEEKAKEKASKWAENDIKEAVEEGILAKNERAKSFSTREESLAFTMRAYRKLKEMIEKKK